MFECLHLTRRSSGNVRSSWPGSGSGRSADRGELGITESCLRNWVAQADVDTGAKPGLSSDERAELAALRREKRRLEMENEILKRAAAYFARENVLPK